MKLAFRLLNTLILYAVVFLLMVMIVWIPRYFHVISDSSSHFVMDFQYHMDWHRYENNLYWYFQNLIVNGNLGKNRLGTPVSHVIGEFIPRSLLVIFTAFLISYPLGVLKGIFDYRARFKKRAAMGELFTFFMLSLPDFFVIICVQWLLIEYIPWIKFLSFGYQHWYSFLLPSLLAAIYPAFYIARITSASIAEQEKEDYVKTALGKGFTKRYVLFKHIMVNSRRTLYNHLPAVMLYILSNLLIIEYLMDFKGGAYRFLFALHYSRAFKLGQQSVYEPEVVIGMALVFISIILLVQWISQILSYFAEPKP